MKYISLLLLTLTLACSSYKPLQHSEIPPKVAVVAFDFKIDDVQVEAPVEESDGLIQAIFDVKEGIETIQRVYGEWNNPENSYALRQLHSSYDVIEDALRYRFDLPVQDVDYLRGEVEYDPIGYPHGDADDVSADNDVEAVIKMDIRVMFLPVTHPNEPHILTRRRAQEFRQGLEFNIKMETLDGETIWRDKSIAWIDEPFIVTESWNWSVRTGTDHPFPELVELTRAAMGELIAKNGLL